MLAALLLLGLLPLATMPMFQSESGESDFGEGMEEEDQAESVLGDGGGAEDDPGAVYQVEAVPGEAVFEDFLVGEDLIRMDLSGQQGDLVFEQVEGADGSAVSFALGENSVSTLRFPNLEALPADDIDLTLPDPDGGSVEMTLAEVIAAVDGEVALGSSDETLMQSEEAGLDPNDPSLPDPVVPGEDAVPGLDPVDPDAPDVPSDESDDAGLDPVGPDDEVLGAEGDLALRDLIERDSTAVHGLGAALQAAFEAGTDDTGLGDGGDAVSLSGGGAATVQMVEGTPVIASDEPIDVVDGGGGDDSIDAGDAAAFVFGGAGDDQVTGGDGASALFGGAGADSLVTGAGSGGFLDGGVGDDTLQGGVGADTLEGGEHAEGWSGDDLIDGGAGDDLIRGGYGDDTLQGGDGDDVIDHLGRAEEREIAEHHEFAWHLDGAADSLSGGAGDDRLIMDGSDVAVGGAGQDLFWVYGNGAGAAEILDFEVGEDFLRLSLNPHVLPAGSPEVSVEASGDGEDALVSVNGDLVAVLRGAAGATAADVYAEVAEDVFPAGP